MRSNDEFIVEPYAWTGGFIKNNDSADDVRDIDLSIVHFLSGPIGVKGAEPGDPVRRVPVGCSSSVCQWGRGLGSCRVPPRVRNPGHMMKVPFNALRGDGPPGHFRGIVRDRLSWT